MFTVLSFCFILYKAQLQKRALIKPSTPMTCNVKQEKLAMLLLMYTFQHFVVGRCFLSHQS